MNKKLHIEIVKAKKSFSNSDARDLVWAHISSGNVKTKSNEVVRCQFSDHIQSYTICSELATVGDSIMLPSWGSVLIHLFPFSGRCLSKRPFSISIS